MKKKKINLLFVCKHNVFRSKTAEAYFKKINKNKNLHADSAGFIKADWLSKPDEIMVKLERKILEKRGISFGKKSKGLSIGLIKNQDLIIIISDDLPNIFKEIYLKKDLEVRIWKIKDVIRTRNEKKVDYIIGQVMKRVDDLVGELK